jgi:nucleoside-triphosphatase THEP1
MAATLSPDLDDWIACSTSSFDLWVVGGPSGSGKTSYCQQLIDQAQQRGWVVTGILSPALFDGATQTAILAQDLTTGIQRPLAIPRSVTDSDQMPATNPLCTPRWRLDPEVLAWGQTVLAAADPQADLLVIDEIGPVELRQHQGWTAAIQAIQSRRYRRTLVTLRPSLLDWAYRWHPHPVICYLS